MIVKVFTQSGPTAAARWFRKAAIRETAVPRNLPEGQFTQLGL